MTNIPRPLIEVGDGGGSGRGDGGVGGVGGDGGVGGVGGGEGGGGHLYENYTLSQLTFISVYFFNNYLLSRVLSLRKEYIIHLL